MNTLKQGVEMPTLCIGHRGAKGHYPENTLPSFAYAIELGCDWIELDVHLVEDELVVIHDSTVNRTTNGTGRVDAYSLADLRALDAGGGAQVPTLTEVTNLLAGRCGLNVELKCPGTANAVSRALHELIDAGWSSEQILVSSFDHQELAKTDATFRRGALFAKRMKDEWESAESLGAYSVNFSLKDVDQALVDLAHARGYKIFVYTVNKPKDIQTILNLGVDGIFSDFPDRVLSLSI
ncbi:MAG: glycerophosphoryl diester phosphodiesterase [Candidatus Azotimanducaceae bacterium]